MFPEPDDDLDPGYEAAHASPPESLIERLGWLGKGPDEPLTWTDLGMRAHAFRNADGIHPAIRALESRPPNRSLAEDLAVFERVNLGPAERALVLDAKLRLRRRAEHDEVVSTRTLVGDEQPTDPQADPYLADFAFLHKLHPNTAIARLAEIRETARLPRLMELLADGKIEWLFVRAVAHETQVLTDTAAAQVDAILAGKAPKLSVAEARSHARKTAMKVDPEHARQKAESTRKTADVTVQPHSSGDGADLIATGPITDIAEIIAAINTRAGLCEHDSSLTAGARRFSALKSLVTGGLDGVLACNSCGQTVHDAERGSRRRRARNRVVVTIPDETLRGGSAPADLEGFGPIDATEARRFAAQPGTTFQRLFYDPATGVATNFDPTRYRLTDNEADFIAFRDGVCMAPGCARPATTCEVDHLFEAGAGGVTLPSNLQSLCDPSHDAKTQHGLVVEQKPDGTGVTWLTPLQRLWGKDYRDHRPGAPPSTSQDDDIDDERPPPF